MEVQAVALGVYNVTYIVAAVAANNLAVAGARNDFNELAEQQNNYAEPSPIDYTAEHSSSSSPVHDPVNSCDGPVDLNESKPAPLDLSKLETPKQQPRVPGSSTNRRKGLAIKLDSRQLENNFC